MYRKHTFRWVYSTRSLFGQNCLVPTPCCKILSRPNVMTTPPSSGTVMLSQLLRLALERESPGSEMCLFIGAVSLKTALYKLQPNGVTLSLRNSDVANHIRSCNTIIPIQLTFKMTNYVIFRFTC